MTEQQTKDEQRCSDPECDHCAWHEALKLRERLPAEDVANPRAKCDVCGRVVDLHRELDGINRPRVDRPYRYSHHAGNRWGRPCRNNGEQYLGDEP